VDLLSDYGVLGTDITVMEPSAASDEQLERVHTRQYLDLLRVASAEPDTWTVPTAGIGTPDDPVFAGVYDASALVCGATIRALRAVLDGESLRAMSIAGGLHHAHPDHASGFCFLNDPAVAIADALARDPQLRIAYVDIDAHHGDGVQAAFYEEPRVLTVSVHESGAFLFPGTGFPGETGAGAAAGTSADLPLPQHAGDGCYRLAMTEFVEPVVTGFRPAVLVAQLGADAHHGDPLTSLGLTLTGYADTVDAIVALADRVCGGRLAATGGGGYGAYSVVPRAWARAAARLAEVTLPEELPATWRQRVHDLGVSPVPDRLTQDDYRADQAEQAMLVSLTQHTIRASLDALSAARGEATR
jgi:acetoin utilization protein AcuC